MTTQPITTRTIAFGIYSATDTFRAIDQHSCVCFADDMGLIAVTGRADDKEAQRWSEFIAAAPETAAERDQLRAVNAELVDALESSCNDGAKLRACISYAINRLTDNDLATVPQYLRHEWVNQSARIKNETLDNMLIHRAAIARAAGANARFTIERGDVSGAQ